MNDLQSGNWTFERPFRFESSGSIEDVVRAMASLEEGGGFFNFSRTRHEMSILPHRDGYNFRYRIRRRNRGSSYTSAYGEGQVWEDETGMTIVEGVSQIEPWSLYGSMGLFVFITILISLTSRGFMGFLPLLFLGLAVYMVFSYYQDRNTVVDRIEEAVRTTTNTSDLFQTRKDKRRPSPEKAKNTRLSVEEAVRPGSIWNEAISEYEDDEQESRQ